MLQSIRDVIGVICEKILTLFWFNSITIAGRRYRSGDPYDTGEARRFTCSEGRTVRDPDRDENLGEWHGDHRISGFVDPARNG